MFKFDGVYIDGIVFPRFFHKVNYSTYMYVKMLTYMYVKMLSPLFFSPLGLRVHTAVLVVQF